MRLLAILVLGLCSWSVEGYKVLCMFPMPSRSHHHLGKGVVEALLQAGHKVTWATPYPETSATWKNVKTIDLSAVLKMEKVLDSVIGRKEPSLTFIFQLSRNVTSVALESPELVDAVVNQQYDAVVTDWFFSDFDAAFAAIQGVPWVLLSSVYMHPHLEGLVGEVQSLATIPQMFNIADTPMTFGQRLLNVGSYWIMAALLWFDRANAVSFYETSFGPLAKARGVKLPPYEEAVHNVSVLLLNSHPSFAPAHSVPPNVISVGGYHIDEHIPPLSKDLQELLDSSPCVVYFSMGSVFKASSLSEETTRELMDMLGSLHCQVLWKYETKLENAPRNVLIKKWFPQPSILAHPNVKVFITHGGLLSILEALNAGVPLLAVPVFGDQPMNAQCTVWAGFARKVDFSSQMAKGVDIELREMLTNDSYSRRVKYLSKLFRSNPVPPKKLISHYIELAIESKGAYHLRSPSHLYAWYQRWMLDLLAVGLLLLYTAYKAIKIIFIVIRKSIVRKRKQKVK